jgi:hypothetical protein
MAVGVGGRLTCLQSRSWLTWYEAGALLAQEVGPLADSARAPRRRVPHHNRFRQGWTLYCGGIIFMSSCTMTINEALNAYANSLLWYNEDKRAY